MWDYIFGLCVTALIGGISYYFYKNRYNDEIIELLNIVHNDIKCIKYYYRGYKYIFLTENLNDDIKRLEREIDSTNPDKDKRPEVEYKCIKIKLFIDAKEKTEEKTEENTEEKTEENTEEKTEENTEEKTEENNNR
jgi:hypothetical protein